MSDHEYTSTACQHDMHRACRVRCKWCEVQCACDCHDDRDWTREPTAGELGLT